MGMYQPQSRSDPNKNTGVKINDFPQDFSANKFMQRTVKKTAIAAAACINPEIANSSPLNKNKIFLVNFVREHAKKKSPHPIIQKFMTSEFGDCTEFRLTEIARQEAIGKKGVRGSPLLRPKKKTKDAINIKM